MSLEKGHIHVYTGPGKGKTTAAIGLGLRATGEGLKVYMIQFMKGRRYSEIDALEHIKNFTVVQFGRDEFVSKEKPEQIDIDLARKGFEHAKVSLAVVVQKMVDSDKSGVIFSKDPSYKNENVIVEGLQLYNTGSDSYSGLIVLDALGVINVTVSNLLNPG